MGDSNAARSQGLDRSNERSAHSANGYVMLLVALGAIVVGVVGAFSMARRRELLTELAPLVTTLEDHPWGAMAAGRTPREAEHSRWARDRDLSFVPLRPERVLEVAYDHLEGDRFRHTAQLRRWRPDRDPSSCTYAQLEEPVSYDLADVLAGR